MEIDIEVNRVSSREEFVGFVRSLLTDLFNNKHEWENDNLADYLEALSAWVEDMDGYYSNQNMSFPENINWNIMARIFHAAKYYE